MQDESADVYAYKYPYRLCRTFDTKLTDPFKAVAKMQLNLARIATAITMGLVEFGDESANGPAGYLNLAAPLITLYAAYGTRRIAVCGIY